MLASEASNNSSSNRLSTDHHHEEVYWVTRRDLDTHSWAHHTLLDCQLPERLISHSAHTARARHQRAKRNEHKLERTPKHPALYLRTTHTHAVVKKRKAFHQSSNNPGSEHPVATEPLLLQQQPTAAEASERVEAKKEGKRKTNSRRTRVNDPQHTHTGGCEQKLECCLASPRLTDASAE